MPDLLFYNILQKNAIHEIEVYIMTEFEKVVWFENEFIMPIELEKKLAEKGVVIRNVGTVIMEIVESEENLLHYVLVTEYVIIELQHIDICEDFDLKKNECKARKKGTEVRITVRGFHCTNDCYCES